MCPFFGGGAGSPSNTMSPGPRPTSIPSGILMHPAVWPQQTWAENWGGAVPVTSNTMWPGLRPTSIPSGILICPTVWPQYTNVITERTGQTDNGPIATAQDEPFHKRSPQNLMHCIKATTGFVNSVVMAIFTSVTYGTVPSCNSLFC